MRDFAFGLLSCVPCYGQEALEIHLAGALDEGGFRRAVPQPDGHVGQGQAMGREMLQQFATGRIRLARLLGGKHGKQLLRPGDEGRIGKGVGIGAQDRLPVRAG
jgi:hypothetical protein